MYLVKYFKILLVVKVTKALFTFPFSIHTQELEDLQKEHGKQRQEIVTEQKRLLEQQEVIKTKLKRHEEEIEAKRKVFSLEMEKVTI